MFSKLFRKVSRRNSDIHERPNRNESGVEKFIDVFTAYYDVLAHIN